MLITSLQNARIKHVVKLNNRRYRDEVAQTMVEGEREVLRALQSGRIPQEAFVCPELITGEDGQTAVTLLHYLAQTNQTQLFAVTTAVFAKIAYRGQSGGLLLVIPYWSVRLADLPAVANPFYIILENVEKPGNLGAILRTADAAGASGVIVTGEASTDLFNPNVVRASLGTLFTVPIAAAAPSELLGWLRQHGITLVATTPAAAVAYTAVAMRDPVAILMGSEAQGLSQPWLEAAHHQALIPMHGVANSLNLATAAALLLYEAVRQRQG